MMTELRQETRMSLLFDWPHRFSSKMSILSHIIEAMKYRGSTNNNMSDYQLAFDSSALIDSLYDNPKARLETGTDLAYWREIVGSGISDSGMIRYLIDVLQKSTSFV